MLTKSDLKTQVKYTPENGIFVRIVDSGCSKKGKILGTKTSFSKRSHTKYITFSVMGRSYSAHRLAWLYMYGSFPSGFIDHIDGDGTNNKIDNLRDVSQLENKRNSRLPRNNTSGVIGVSWAKTQNLWCAHIMVNKKSINLGMYETIFDAVCVRKSAEKKYGFHVNHGSKSSLISKPLILTGK